MRERLESLEAQLGQLHDPHAFDLRALALTPGDLQTLEQLLALSRKAERYREPSGGLSAAELTEAAALDAWLADVSQRLPETQAKDFYAFVRNKLQTIELARAYQARRRVA